MTTQDISSLIDWNSPTVEFHCKPLIPPPNFDGQPVIDGDNPFDALEKQIDQNEPFDMILNQSLNSSSEQIDADQVMETNDGKPSHNVTKSNEMNSVTSVIDSLNRLNLHLNESVYESAPESEFRYSGDVSNMLDVSPIESEGSEVQLLRKRLSTILDNFSKPAEENNSKEPSTQSSSGNSLFSTKWYSIENDVNEIINASGTINKAFIGQSGMNDTTFDSLMLNSNQLYEDLSCVVSPAWDELALISSSSDEESEKLPVKRIPSKNSSMLSNKTNGEKVVIKRSCPRLPLGSKDPNIRTKRMTKVVKESGPLKAVIPIESMAKNLTQKLVETPKLNRLSRKLKADSTALKTKRRSVPVATSTPVGMQSPQTINKSKIATHSKSSTPTTKASRSCPPSPDSTTARPVFKSTSSKVKICSRRLALNVVSSSTSTSFNYLSSSKKTSRDVKHSSLNLSSNRSMATGVKSCVKNKENLVPFRF
ncbi:uncharacterized protein LOC135831671 isoform X1 [Planococcus citri]|uniref:uncharacterized protein LOC135831671 isoform X1 n=1 Tax=Planococcus citri TaxID=170843 RepID=UPI0031F9DD52